MHLAGADVEVDAVERRDAREALGDTAQPNDGTIAVASRHPAFELPALIRPGNGAGTLAVMVRVALVLALLLAAPADARVRAPGAPGTKATWAPADKRAFGTATARKSRVWFTLRGAGATEVFYPDLAHPSARAIDLYVDGRREAGTVAVAQSDPASLTFTQTVTAKRWRLTKTYVTDPARATLLVRVRFESLDGKAHAVAVRYDPSLYGDGNDDVGWTRGHALLAHDRHIAGALTARPAFGRTSSGYAGKSAGTLDHAYDALTAGNVVQTAATELTGRGSHRDLTLALGFGLRATLALDAAQASLKRGFANVLAAYSAGWKAWRAKQQPIPAAAVPYAARYETSLLVLKASVDKGVPGAFASAPAAGHGASAREQYEIATALLVAGDVDDADSALDVLAARFPNSAWVPVLAYQLARTDGETWGRVQQAGDYVAKHRPKTAAAVAGLVCAAGIARENGDTARAARYEKAADALHAAIRPAGLEALEAGAARRPGRGRPGRGRGRGRARAGHGVAADRRPRRVRAALRPPGDGPAGGARGRRRRRRDAPREGQGRRLPGAVRLVARGARAARLGRRGGARAGAAVDRRRALRDRRCLSAILS